MARIDKYNPVNGGFRAKLGFAVAASDVGDVIGVLIDGAGLVQKGGVATTEAVIVPSSVMSTGDTVDCMTSGEVVDIKAGDNVTGFATGAKAYAAAAGAIGVTAPGAGVNGVYIGSFVEAWRLVVRVQKAQG